MKVLLIKLTSMGDLTHALPAITDAASIYPDIEFHWVVDEAFAEIPGWHPNVTRVIKSAHRRWKKNKRATWLQGEFKHFYRELNAEDYDFIFDGQNNLKSATISFLRRGKVAGCDKATAREFPAHWAYSQTHHVALNQHAIERQRELFAKVLGYSKPDTPADYGIDFSRLRLPAMSLAERFLVYVHNASWDTKLYPNQHWLRLIELAAKDHYTVYLPCGNQEEYERAQMLAENYDNAVALPKMSLSEIAGLMHRARGAICCDTGLAHIAGVLSLPAVTLYGPTDDKLIGTYGQHQQLLVANQFTCAPCYKKTCHYHGAPSTEAACMRDFEPETVWRNLTRLIHQ